LRQLPPRTLPPRQRPSYVLAVVPGDIPETTPEAKEK
jgi:hypothetical protein